MTDQAAHEARLRKWASAEHQTLGFSERQVDAQAVLDALTAERALAEQTRAEVDRQLGRHLCYTSADSRERFWRAVDAALAAASPVERTDGDTA